MASPIFFPWNSETEYLAVAHADIEDCGNHAGGPLALAQDDLPLGVIDGDHVYLYVSGPVTLDMLRHEPEAAFDGLVPNPCSCQLLL